MKKLNKNEKTLVMVTSAVAFVYLFNLLIFSPLRGKFGGLEDNISRSELMLRRYQELERKRDYLLAQSQDIEKYLALAGSPNERITAILSKIESETRKAGLTVLDMKPDASSTALVGEGIYRVQLHCEGDVKKIFSFIYSLENADVLFKIDRLNLSLKDETSGIMKLEAGILGITFS